MAVLGWHILSLALHSFMLEEVEVPPKEVEVLRVLEEVELVEME